MDSRRSISWMKWLYWRRQHSNVTQVRQTPPATSPSDRGAQWNVSEHNGRFLQPLFIILKRQTTRQFLHHEGRWSRPAALPVPPLRATCLCLESWRRQTKSKIKLSPPEALSKPSHNYYWTQATHFRALSLFQELFAFGSVKTTFPYLHLLDVLGEESLGSQAILVLLYVQDFAVHFLKRTKNTQHSGWHIPTHHQKGRFPHPSVSSGKLNWGCTPGEDPDFPFSSLSPQQEPPCRAGQPSVGRAVALSKLASCLVESLHVWPFLVGRSEI